MNWLPLLTSTTVKLVERAKLWCKIKAYSSSQHISTFVQIWSNLGDDGYTSVEQIVNKVYETFDSNAVPKCANLVDLEKCCELVFTFKDRLRHSRERPHLSLLPRPYILLLQYLDSFFHCPGFGIRNFITLFLSIESTKAADALRRAVEAGDEVFQFSRLC